MNKKRIVVAMSGGIDSSVAAKLLIDSGFEVIGLTFVMYKSEEFTDFNSSINDAQIIATKLGIKHYTIDISEDFELKIINYFVNSYLNGKTPNPCTLCNRIVKFKHLLDFADKVDSFYVATGHYAKINQNGNRFFISKATDLWKDQSYFLWNLTQEQLQRTIFPLNDLTKDGIRQIAAENDFTNVLHKRESYDVCFIRDVDYRVYINRFIEKNSISIQSGDFVTEDGKVVGQHNGITHYTIGQRKGLGFAMGIPYYVKSMDLQTNRIIVSSRENLNGNSLILKDVNLQKYAEFDKNIQFTTKIRYRDVGHLSGVIKEKDVYKVNFSENVFGIAPGQSAVFYENDDVVGGGIIEN